MSKIVDSFNYNIKKTVDDWGKDITIYYKSTANCSSCSYNPITKDGTNPTCSTCNGSYFFYTTTAWSCKAVVRTFVGDKGYLDWVSRKINFYPEADIRMTCWLSDVLMNIHSSTGKTYFDKADHVYFEGKNYAVKKVYRTGLKAPTVCIVNLEETK